MRMRDSWRLSVRESQRPNAAIREFPSDSSARNGNDGARTTMFEAVFVGRFRAQFDALTETEQGEVQRLIRLIEIDPHVDGVHTVDFPVPPVILRAYDNGLWRIAHRVVDDRFIELYAVSRIWPP